MGKLINTLQEEEELVRFKLLRGQNGELIGSYYHRIAIKK